MYMIYYKSMFMILNMITIIFMLNINNWMMMWINLEMNMIMIIPLINNNFFINSSIKYFIIQTISSSFLLINLLMNYSLILYSYNLNKILIMISMMIKMSLLPFHFWMINISKFIKWIMFTLMLTTQKIPIFIMFNFMMMKMIMPFILMSMTLTLILNMNQNLIYKIMIYSSINNSSIMLMTITFNQINWMMFFINYSIMMYMMNMLLFYKLNFFYINQIKLMSNFYFKLNIMLMFMSMISIPPFIMFFPKWMLLNMFLFNYFYMIIIMMITMMMMIFIYFKLMILLLFSYNTMNKLLINNFNINIFMLNYMYLIFLLM